MHDFLMFKRILILIFHCFAYGTVFKFERDLNLSNNDFVFKLSFKTNKAAFPFLPQLLALLSRPLNQPQLLLEVTH